MKLWEYAKKTKITTIRLLRVSSDRYIEFVRYIDIFFISDTVWGNNVYIDIQ